MAKQEFVHFQTDVEKVCPLRSINVSTIKRHTWLSLHGSSGKLLFSRQKIMSPFVWVRCSLSPLAHKSISKEFGMVFLNYCLAGCLPHPGSSLRAVTAGRDLWSSGAIKKSLHCFLLISQREGICWTPKGLCFSGASASGRERKQLKNSPSSKSKWFKSQGNCGSGVVASDPLESSEGRGHKQPHHAHYFSKNLAGQRNQPPTPFHSLVPAFVLGKCPKCHF